jgi:hypothetical protein
MSFSTLITLHVKSTTDAPEVKKQLNGMRIWRIPFFVEEDRK